MEPIIYNRKNENMFMPAYVNVDKRFRFSQGAITLLQLKVGRYIHLLEFGDTDWYFMIDDDNMGLRLGSEGNHVVAHASQICKNFLHRVRQMGKYKFGSIAFYISKTQKEYKGKTLYKIELDRPFQNARGSRKT